MRLDATFAYFLMDVEALLRSSRARSAERSTQLVDSVKNVKMTSLEGIMSDLYHLEGNEKAIVISALTLYVNKLANTRVVTCNDPLAMHNEYKCSQALLKSLSFQDSDKPYHSLLIMRNENEWEIDFGSFDYGEVMLEGSQHESDASNPYLIITTKSDQESIKSELIRLNIILVNEAYEKERQNE